jgi:3-hydroxyacyl-[acyl-carrier-protein] dehydratase
VSETGMDANKAPAVLENKDIQALLPHRYPFLLVDRIVDIVPDGSGGTGIKNVTANEPQFMGHFPNNPVMPGVLIIEGMAQTAGAIAASLQGAAGSSSVLFLTIDGAKFRKQVVPGDRLEYRVTRKAKKRAMYWFRGEAYVDGQLVAEAEVGAMITAG